MFNLRVQKNPTNRTDLYPFRWDLKGASSKLVEISTNVSAAAAVLRRRLLSNRSMTLKSPNCKGQKEKHDNIRL